MSAPHSTEFVRGRAVDDPIAHTPRSSESETPAVRGLAERRQDFELAARRTALFLGVILTIAAIIGTFAVTSVETLAGCAGALAAAVVLVRLAIAGAAGEPPVGNDPD